MFLDDVLHLKATLSIWPITLWHYQLTFDCLISHVYWRSLVRLWLECSLSRGAFQLILALSKTIQFLLSPFFSAGFSLSFTHHMSKSGWGKSKNSILIWFIQHDLSFIRKSPKLTIKLGNPSGISIHPKLEMPTPIKLSNSTKLPAGSWKICKCTTPSRWYGIYCLCWHHHQKVHQS